MFERTVQNIQSFSYSIEQTIMARKKRKELPLYENVEITGIAAEGNALTRVELPPDGRPFVVFVPYGAPGDIVDIQIDKKRKSYAEGHIVKMHRKSDSRVEPECRHYGVCGGCRWQHLDYATQLKNKHQQVVDVLDRIAKLPHPEVRPTLGSERHYHYRNKMEYTFSCKKWRTWDEVKSGVEFTDRPEALGFHIAGAFDKVLHIDECHLQDDLGNQIRNSIYEYAIDNNLDFYDIKANQGLLRTLLLRIADSGETMVCVSFGCDDTDAINGVMTHISEQFPQITSLLYVVNTKLNDTIGDLDVITFKGKPYITENMGKLRYRIGPKSFYQTNSAQAERLYGVARDFCGFDEMNEPPLVYDLYTGAGTIANFVADKARKVVGIEYVEDAIIDARLNSEANGISNTLFFAGDMKDILTDKFIAEHGRPDIMIIDPPRAGMHQDVVDVILRTAPARLVYVSCNPATQARDLALLAEKYDITAVQPVDMFPHTHHVENVVRLDLRKE